MTGNFNRALRLLGIGLGLVNCILVPRSSAQGLVYFNNRVAGVVDARVTFEVSCGNYSGNSGTGVGAGFTAQLFGGPEGTQLFNLTPLFPTTTFRTSSGEAQGYVDPVVVEVPGVPSGKRAIFQMRVFGDGVIWVNRLLLRSPLVATF